MSTFAPNPEAEAKIAFDLAAPGEYRMRIAEVGDAKTSGKGNTYCPTRLEFVDPSGVTKEDGSIAKNPGAVFDNVMIAPAELQGRLRGLVEATGNTWGAITDLKQLVGQELSVKLKIRRSDEYGDRNEVAFYLSQEG